MHSPFSVLFFLLLVSALIATFQLGILTIAFAKLGLSPSSALVILLASFVGSFINIPLFKMKSNQPVSLQTPIWLKNFFRSPPRLFEGFTYIHVNVGGCLIPLLVTFYLLQQADFDLALLLFAIFLMTTLSYSFSRPITGIGIGMPVFLAPFAAAIIALILAPQHSAVLAYISGTLGVLIGADLLRLRDIKRMGTSFASIGGAGTFDGIFITGIVAALLA